MSKPKSFFQNLIKPFKRSSTRGQSCESSPAFVVSMFSNIFLMDCGSLCLFFIDQNELDLETIAAQEQKLFPFKALVAATKNFHPSQKLGEGGFGPVFRVNKLINSV